MVLQLLLEEGGSQMLATKGSDGEIPLLLTLQRTQEGCFYKNLKEFVTIILKRYKELRLSLADPDTNGSSPLMLLCSYNDDEVDIDVAVEIAEVILDMEPATVHQSGLLYRAGIQSVWFDDVS